MMTAWVCLSFLWFCFICPTLRTDLTETRMFDWTVDFALTWIYEKVWGDEVTEEHRYNEARCDESLFVHGNLPWPGNFFSWRVRQNSQVLQQLKQWEMHPKIWSWLVIKLKIHSPPLPAPLHFRVITFYVTCSWRTVCLGQGRLRHLEATD